MMHRFHINQRAIDAHACRSLSHRLLGENQVNQSGIFLIISTSLIILWKPYWQDVMILIIRQRNRVSTIHSDDVNAVLVCLPIKGGKNNEIAIGLFIYRS
ncbi:MAG TPA: hypothetical protein G4N92_01960 [Anaerolineae bacterium]|nr:hypothetical protein [Anaerolineae bacterium]